jgi:hypothetical protein
LAAQFSACGNTKPEPASDDPNAVEGSLVT